MVLQTNPFCHRFSLKKIRSATNDFNYALVIGAGGFGKVYKGVVDIGDEKSTMVAIKRLSPDSMQGDQEFEAEIEMLSKLRHINLVSLFGYCDDDPEMLLIYQFMPNGTLSDHLYPKTSTKSSSNCASSSSSPPFTPLSWKQRLMICIGAARGLEYLHTGTGAKHRIIHRDVKSSNILLDENWVAKISDFGLSKIGPANQSCTKVITNPKGTPGYLDPEYFMTGVLTRKCDVYAFGVVLFEVLCARRALDHKLDKEQRNLALWVQHCVEQGTFDQIIDPHLRGQISPDCLNAFMKIASDCLIKEPERRPSMSEIVFRLESALASSQKRADSSTKRVKGFPKEDEDFGNVADPPTSSQPDVVLKEGTKLVTNKGDNGERGL